ENAVALDEIHALERDVETSVVGIAEEHELAAAAIGFDLAQAIELTDAVIDVHDVVAGLQIGKVAEETGGANLAAGALDGGQDVEEVGVAEESDLGVRKRHALREGRTNQQKRSGFLDAFGDESRGSIFGFAEHIEDFVFASDIAEAFKFAGASNG